MQKERLLSLWDPQSVGATLALYDCVTSTNALLKEQARVAQSDAAAPKILLANAQSDGRGRLGRSFYSPDGTGIYCSILLYPTLPAQDALLLTTAAAVAAVRAMRALDLDVSIKWVNDLYCRGKKVAGILTESALNADATLSYAVVGIGINVAPPTQGFPPQLCSIAGALYESTPAEGTAEALCASFLQHFFDLYKALPDRSFLAEYRRYNLVLGKTVNYQVGSQTYSGVASAIDDNANLVITDNSGASHTFGCGEITLCKEGLLP